MKRFLAAALFSAALLVPTLAPTATAQEVRSDHAFRAIEMQMLTTLESGDYETQNVQLLNAIALATLYRQNIDLWQSVPAIIQIHKSTDSQLTRLRAVAALQTIDSFEARRYLSKHVSEDEVAASRVAMIEALQKMNSSSPTIARN
jgi:hypothetical protein